MTIRSAAYRLLVPPLSLLGACVIPLPIDVAVQDGGAANSPPAIVGSTPDMPGGDIMLLIGGGPSPPVFSVSVVDVDLGDTLYARVFRDYDDSPSGYLA